MKTFAHPQTSLNKSINRLIKNFPENINIGIQVEDLNTGKVLYSKNANRYFAPASNQKIFTAWAALNYLGENFTYKTELFLDPSKIQNNVLQDNIYLHFSGDPTLTVEQLDELINAIALAGIHKINGSIVIDDTAFDQSPLSPGTSWDDAETCFGSPINSIIVNHNCISAKLKPATKVGDKAIMELPAYPQSMQFQNQVMTESAKTEGCKIEIVKIDSKSYLVKGCIKENSPHLDLSAAIQNPRENLQLLLNYLLQKNKIIANGFEYQKITITKPPFKVIASQPLSNMLATMLKDSDNTIANALFKTMGAAYSNQPGSWVNGKDALHSIISKTLLTNVSEQSMQAGAGLSRYLAHSPEQLVAVLRKVYFSKDGKTFVAALPIAGIDGTLKDRMKNPAILGKIRAKTGSLTGVSTLSGYIDTKHKHKIVFSILINSFASDEEHYKNLEDEICLAIANLD